jgi:hypothetical protein
MKGSCESGNELSDAIQSGEMVEQLSGYELSKSSA